MVDRGGEGNRPPRRTLGDYAYQQGPKNYNSIVIPPFSNKVVELKPALLSLIGSHPFAGMDHEDPYTHFSTFMELCSTMGASDEDVEAVYLRDFPFSLAGKAKTWLQSYPHKSLNTWEEVEEKLIASGLKPQTKMILDASTGGTMMSKSMEEVIVITDSIAASDYQSHHDRALTQRKGTMELNTQSTILAQSKLLKQQIEALIKQHLVMDNKKMRPIICRTKPYLNKNSKEAVASLN
ncbi:hypothetical protein D0Y65_050669 [Glycine soja]|uniref:Retrotransposon gag domain-containing protein n=1 Tax=Glycine soja TaxID=3848 RepID=A0A445FD00_GLYSO|nr:hypothetical protein D0Y65_050669 [Glycine soja]